MTQVSTAVEAQSKPRTPQPGVYKDLPFGEYCDWPFVNNSSLKPLRQSPAHYKQCQIEPRKDTVALGFGRFVHSSFGPDSLTDLYAIMPDLTEGIDSTRPKATKVYKERLAQFHELAGDKEIVDAEWLADTQAMLKAMWANPAACKYLAHPGPAEASVIWDEPTTGIRCKARLDKWDPQRRIIADIKTTADVADFERAIGRYAYHQQAAFYCDAAQSVTGEPHRFAIVAVEKTPPYAVRAALMDDESVAAGRRQYLRALHTLQECWEADVWPGPANPPAWHAPHWALEQPLALTREGEVVHEYS